MQNYKNLIVWSISFDLVEEIYSITKSFPQDERFHLVSQMRRCATSIPCNISEGCGRVSQKDKARFFQIAYGSACELEVQLLLTKRLGYLNRVQFEELHSTAIDIKKMLSSLIKVVLST